MKVFCLHAGAYASNSYVVVSDDNSEAVLIDPSVNSDFVFRQCKDIPPIKKILLTHAHFDHVMALEQWKKERDVKLYATQKASIALTDSEQNGNSVFLGINKTYPAADFIVSDGDVIKFGDSELTVMLTPGHTAGSCCYIADGVAFTGDTVFADGGVGRTDLYGGSDQELYNSIVKIFSLLDDNTVIYSGHGRESTVKKEKYNHRTII